MLTTLTPLVYWWATVLAGPWEDPKGDVLIVLTGSVLDERTIGMNSYWRALYAAHVFLDEHFEEMIVSGGAADGTPAAALMRDFIVAQGVPSSAVQVESVSRDTHESAFLVADLLRADSRYRNRRLVLLTSDYHMFRAHRAFRRAGVDLAPRPIPDARKRYNALLQRWPILFELLEETAKSGYYWSRGWI
jgi:uncharacterized SAM-binding protein YcdF (DUF218 family)